LRVARDINGSRSPGPSVRGKVGPVQIQTIHWTVVPAGLAPYLRSELLKEVVAVWPGPIPQDGPSPFADAGFSEMGDPSDPSWDLELKELIQRFIDFMRSHGPPLLKQGGRASPPFLHRLPAFRRRESRVLEAFTTGMSDSDAPCLVEWGAPLRARVATGDALPILWIAGATSIMNAMPNLFKELAQGRPTYESRLNAGVILERSSHPSLR
jgi:hypothetical protein